MSSFSVVVLVGNLTRDAQLKYTPSGFPIASFSIAINTRRKQGDQYVDEASFFDVELLGKTAESLNQYLTKGKLIGVEGELRQDRWEQDGQARSKVKVLANKVQLLGGNGQGQAQGSTGESNTGQAPARSASAVSGTAKPTDGQAAELFKDNAAATDDFSDDIPF